MNSRDRLEEAMLFLANSDEEYARLRSNADRMEQKAKAIRAQVFLHEQGTVAERQAKAEVSKDYWAAYEEYLTAKQLSDTMGHRRETEDRAIDVVRTIEASRRKT
jgi:hypothetical protein